MDCHVKQERFCMRQCREENIEMKNEIESGATAIQSGKLSKLSRRQLFFRGAAITAGGAALLATSTIPAQAKMPQQAAAYQNTPKGDQSCANCSLFKAPSSCTLV